MNRQWRRQPQAPRKPGPSPGVSPFFMGRCFSLSVVICRICRCGSTGAASTPTPLPVTQRLQQHRAETSSVVLTPRRFARGVPRVAPVESIVARKMHRTLEPFYGMIFFTPAAPPRYAAAGVTGQQSGYFASRAAPMGSVPAEVVTATFFNWPSAQNPSDCPSGEKNGPRAPSSIPGI